ncbi:hypothetical protein ACTFIY_004468 [Dictyostelium cf. discoideum]
MRLSGILLLLSAFAGIINSQYVLIEEFQYQGASCSGSQSSIDSQSSFDSQSSWASQSSWGSQSSWASQSSWGSSDSSNFLTASESSGEACPSSSIGGNIVQEGVCFYYADRLPSIYTVSGENIVQTFYNETDYNCEGKPIDTVTAISGDCYSACNQGTGITFQLSAVSTPVIPTTNTIIEAVYTGECNGNYKNSFVSVYYKSLNTCNDNIVSQQGTVSFELSCNSTSSAVTIFGNDDCGGSPVYTLHEPIVNQCGDKYNVIEVCYN